MRILDKTRNVALSNGILYVTDAEALELIEGLRQLIDDPNPNHLHFYDRDFLCSLAVTVIRRHQLHFLDEKSQELVKDVDFSDDPLRPE
jgi:hypothetical protein